MSCVGTNSTGCRPMPMMRALCGKNRPRKPSSLTSLQPGEAASHTTHSFFGLVLHLVDIRIFYFCNSISSPWGCSWACGRWSGGARATDRPPYLFSRTSQMRLEERKILMSSFGSRKIESDDNKTRSFPCANRRRSWSTDSFLIVCLQQDFSSSNIRIVSFFV